MHPLEDRSFRFSVDEFGISVYGVFDGFGGSQVINEISQKASNNKKKFLILHKQLIYQSFYIY